jgi:hypothetical protein
MVTSFTLLSFREAICHLPARVSGAPPHGVCHFSRPGARSNPLMDSSTPRRVRSVPFDAVHRELSEADFSPLGGAAPAAATLAFDA